MYFKSKIINMVNYLWCFNVKQTKKSSVAISRPAFLDDSNEIVETILTCWQIQIKMPAFHYSSLKANKFLSGFFISLAEWQLKSTNRLASESVYESFVHKVLTPQGDQSV